MAEPTARLLIEYDGTEFAGWASQPGRRTVQAELERALAVVLRRPEPVGLTVAGRTDAGVHAVAQVASYRGEPVPARALNALLPPDIAVRECVSAPPGFSARHDATSRAYRYTLLTRPARSPFDARTTLHWPHPLQDGALHACAATLLGEHDFTAFTPTETAHVRFERAIRHAAWTRETDRLVFTIEGNAFMRHMVRVLVGTMLEAGRGRRTPAGFAELLLGRPREAAGPTAAARGLTLVGVGFGGAPVLDASGRRSAA